MDAEAFIQQVCMYMCKFEREPLQKHTHHLVRWLENWYESRWERERESKRIEVMCKNFPFPVASREYLIHTVHHIIARVCVLVWHTNMDIREERFQAVPFHSTHTTTIWYWHSHISISYACLCISMLYRHLGNLQYSLPFEQQQQQQQRREKNNNRDLLEFIDF